MHKSADPFYAMLGKALVDEQYRNKLKNAETRADAFADIGISHPTEDQLLAVENAFTASETLRGTFGDEVGAA
jgi:hypothetical protein